MNTLAGSANFRARFCQSFRCAPEEFERKLFWKSLYPHARLAAGLILLVRPRFFKNEFDALRQIGLSRDLDEARQEIDFLASLTRQEGSVLKKKLRLRISGRRLLTLLRRL